MSNDLIRDQFETYWARQLWAECYEDVKEQMFTIWKASRETVVVKLPPRKSIDHYCYDQGANCNAEGHNQCRAQVSDAIEAQGLKVAP